MMRYEVLKRVNVFIIAIKTRMKSRHWKLKIIVSLSQIDFKELSQIVRLNTLQFTLDKLRNFNSPWEHFIKNFPFSYT